MGEWQKIFVRKLVDHGVTYESAMLAMGLACDERSNAYMEGYSKGFNTCCEVGKASTRREIKDRVIINEGDFSRALNNIRKLIESPSNPAALTMARWAVDTLDDYRPSKLTEYLKQQEANPK